MGLRVCLVTPFAWSQPHDVNEHVAGVAKELRTRGHSVTVLASSIFGPGAFLVNVQAHTLWIEQAPGPDWTYKREGGQLLLLHVPGG